jgi:SnoaL-like domain
MVLHPEWQWPAVGGNRISVDVADNDSTRRVVDRWAEIMASGGKDLSEVCHPDFIEDTPQSGERIRGLENHRAILENYPRRDEMKGELERIVGSEDKWVSTPSFTLLKIVGKGDSYTVLAKVAYADQGEFDVVSVLELRLGKIARATTFFAAPFEAPEWRSQWVERIGA